MQVKHELVEEICGRKGRKVFVIVPEENLDVNLESLKICLEKLGFSIEVEGKLGLTFKHKVGKASVLKSGVAILEGLKEKEEALKLFSELTSC